MFETPEFTIAIILLCSAAFTIFVFIFSRDHRSEAERVIHEALDTLKEGEESYWAMVQKIAYLKLAGLPNDEVLLEQARYRREQLDHIRAQIDVIREQMRQRDQATMGTSGLISWWPREDKEETTNDAND
jgi:hypothetical protein